MKRVIYAILIVASIGAITWVTNSLAQQKKETKAKATEPPIGAPRTAEEFSADAAYLIEARRSTVYDGESAYLFKPERCIRCHEDKPEVEGQKFYGYADFRKDVDWPGFISHADRKHAPSLTEYSFSDTHFVKKRKVPVKIGQDIEQRMKQMQ